MSYTSRPTYTEQEPRIRLVSRPMHKRPAFAVTTAMLGITTVLAITLFAGSLNALRRFPALSAFATVMLIVSIVVAGYVIFIAWRLISYASKEYVFELADDEARLKIVDRRSQRKLIARIPWQDVDYVEFFTPRDSSALVFHSKTGRLIEVPMWALTNDPSSILHFLADKQISVVRL